MVLNINNISIMGTRVLNLGNRVKRDMDLERCQFSRLPKDILRMDHL